MSIGCTSLTMDSEHYYDEAHCTRFMSDLKKLWQKASFCDVTLKVENVSIKCHKAVLCAGSSYFSTMFSSGFEEEAKTEVELKGIDEASMLSLVGYVYTGKIEFDIYNAQSLIQSSDLLQLDSVKFACAEFMVQHVDPSNCIGFYHFAKLYGLKQLKSKARSCMVEKFTEVIKSPEFNIMTKDNLIEYISDDLVDVPNENIIFRAVVAWINGNLSERKQFFAAVAEHIRFPFCTASYLCHEVSQSPLMETPECQVLLQEACWYHMIIGQETSIISPRTKARRSFGLDRHLLVLGGFEQGEEGLNRNIWFTKEGGSTWDLLSKLPKGIAQEHSACVVPGGIVVTGGFLKNKVLGYCWLFETVAQKWTGLPSMDVERGWHQSLFHDDAVFVAGGSDGEIILDSVEKFDLKKHKWTSVCPMLAPVCYPPLVTFRSSIYALGSFDKNWEPMLCTQEYDTVCDIWRMKTEIPEDGVGAAVSLGDTIYVLGSKPRSFLSYQPLSDTWTSLVSPQLPHVWRPVVVWRDKILTCGGYLEGGWSSEIEQYDPKSQTWSRLYMKMPVALFGHHVFNIAMN